MIMQKGKKKKQSEEKEAIVRTTFRYEMLELSGMA